METIWKIEEHTKAKHRILRECWNGWLPILAQTHPAVTYFEGFAGPGVYVDGEPGSPVVALEAAIGHHLRSNFGEVIFYLVEQRHDRVERLRSEIEVRRPRVPTAWKTHVIEGEFVGLMLPTFQAFERTGAQLAPTFAFLDPFGFGDLPMDLVTRILAYRWCDVLITFDVRDINRFAESPDHTEAIDRCLGTNDWASRIREWNGDRRDCFLRMYEKELEHRVPGCGVRSFEMSGTHGPIYQLVGATKHKEGMKVIKRAMWMEDPTGRYRFSDRTAGQNTLLEWQDEPAWIEAAALEVERKFRGKTAYLEEVEDYVLFKTIYQFRKATLQRLKAQGKVDHVTAPTGHPAERGFPDGCRIRFSD